MARPVQTLAEWLKSQGTDLLFVPVPKMTEVYPEHFASNCPKDRIAAPAVRRLMAELLEKDVEEMDLLPALLAARDQDDFLYQSADPHWSPRAQMLGARIIAERLKRYEFVQPAQGSACTYLVKDGVYPPFAEACAYGALTAGQKEQARRAWPTTRSEVTFPGGKAFFSWE